MWLGLWCSDDVAVAEEQMELVRKARRYEVEVEREREQARLRHLAELERQRADKRARCVMCVTFGSCACVVGAALVG